MYQEGQYGAVPYSEQYYYDPQNQPQYNAPGYAPYYTPNFDPNAGYYQPPPPQEAYYNNYVEHPPQRGGRRGRGGGRGGRGGANRGAHQFNYQYEYDGYGPNPQDYQESKKTPSQHEATASVEEGSKSARPKHRSYQDNRYRDNRSQRRPRGGITQKNDKDASDWRNNVSEQSSVPLNMAYEEGKDDPDFSAVSQNGSGEGGNLPIKSSTRGGRGYLRNKESRTKISKDKSNAVNDMVVNKMKVTSEPTSLGYVKQETKRELKERLEGKDTERRNSPRQESEDMDQRGYDRREQNYERGRGRGGKGRFVKGKKRDDQDQRELLTEQLSRAMYECSVCCDAVRRDAAIWSCAQCFNVFHLRCVKKWARNPSSAAEEGGDSGNGWRCPACQNVCKHFPGQYRCFCGKVRDPDYNRYETPHSCGNLCGKKRGNSGECTHPCNVLCHPGPCPTCQATVNKSCNCGSFKMTVKCGQAPVVRCTNTCKKTLNCGRHECQEVCHKDSCEPCEEIVHQECYCGEHSRDVICGTSESFTTAYSCNNTCNRSLSCGGHNCKSTCHPGECGTCDLLPGVVTHCPCGKSLLSSLFGTQQRDACTDPVPTCSRTCDKMLPCGPRDCPHTCAAPCHEGPCPPCPQRTDISCRCGEFSKHMPCIEAATYTDSSPFTCERRCSKKRDCGRHRCTVLCCVEDEHKCEMICGKKLSCGLHRCEEPCHRGNCPPCWQASFDELHCHCGSEVLMPPVPCGARPPECHNVCMREHVCIHPVTHYCHSEARCTPCTHLTEKWCMGRHELRKNIPCHLADISCGLPCAKILPCGLHKCQKTCHKGECLTDEEVCKQPCSNKRVACDHPCAAPCHMEKPCPENTCKAEVLLRCDCGRRSEKSSCLAGGNAMDYNKLATSMMAMKMAADGSESFDISALTKSNSADKKLRKLDCDKECALMERNKRLALALEIKNPDITGKLSGNPAFSDFLKSFASKNVNFIISIEGPFRQLVESAQSSKQKSRSHAFPVMSNVQRRVIHELAEMYGCQTQSYDEEPHKNVVATAYKNKCWLPTMTLSSLVLKKAPLPIPLFKKEADIRADAAKPVMGAWGKKLVAPSSSSSSSLSSAAAASSKGSSSSLPSTPRSSGSSLNASAPPLRSKLTTLTKSSTESSTSKPAAEPVIDYFDMTD